MTSFTFEAQARPFPRWMGPFSPARGTNSGFRFHGGKLGTWVGDDFQREFWPIVDSPGSIALTNLVINRWGGGRVLLLPSGFVIKPLQKDSDVGKREFLGKFSGSVVLKKPTGGVFDLSTPGNLRPGDRWPGPKTTGLECAIGDSGALNCTWYHPIPLGREDVTKQLRGQDPSLIAGFRKCRPSVGGRVRITASGHIITNRQLGGNWIAYYVGRIDPAAWKADWKKWIE
jgi:hypothetical protein